MTSLSVTAVSQKTSLGGYGQSRDKTIKGAGEYSYPRMLFFSRNQSPRYRGSHAPVCGEVATEPKYPI